MSCEEVCSVEGLLEKAQNGLDERELSELKRILYGRPAEYVLENSCKYKYTRVNDIFVLKGSLNPGGSSQAGN